jgi:hypothetical protein
MERANPHRTKVAPETIHKIDFKKKLSSKAVMETTHKIDEGVYNK